MEQRRVILELTTLFATTSASIGKCMNNLSKEEVEEEAHKPIEM